MCVRDRTGELTQLTTKTYIVQNLMHDLLSGKALNKAGYRAIYHEDPEESEVYAVLDRKICKSRSFHLWVTMTIFYILKQNHWPRSNLGRCRGMSSTAAVVLKAGPFFKQKYPRHYSSFCRTGRSHVKEIWFTCEMSILYDWEEYFGRSTQAEGSYSGTTWASKHDQFHQLKVTITQLFCWL